MPSNDIPHAEERPTGASRSTHDADAEPIVALSGVGKRFASGLEALDRIDLSVARGEFLSLLGPSGCGKSTLLRIIAGLSEPTRGTCRVSLGEPGKPIPSGRIGFVFQDPTLMPWSTVAANAELPFRIAGRVGAKERDRIAAALRAVGLAGFEGAYPHQLSGGMRMRVSIARALVTDPELLLLDEPFAALDEITRFALNDDLLRLWETRRPTVLFVTHSVFESVYLSTRIAVMRPRPGRIVADLPVGLPHPRAGARTMPAYAALCETVSRSRLLELSLFPYAVILQVTPIVAIAPLLIIWVRQPFLALLVCAWIVALFPIVSNTTVGLNSADRNLLMLFRLYGASPGQTLLYLRLPTALPYFLAGLRISGGLALIGAVVAEFVAGTGGAETGLAFRILEAGYRLAIPRLFAALFLLSLTGIVIYLLLDWLSRRLLQHWHESAAQAEEE